QTSPRRSNGFHVGAHIYLPTPVISYYNFLLVLALITTTAATIRELKGVSIDQYQRRNYIV
ncbi:MAG TPA: hypothetical protein VGQ81_04520, partial [Acidobacteriota bacterium]|nr:hypothetical protein [Acidobacteriota bacterium]